MISYHWYVKIHLEERKDTFRASETIKMVSSIQITLKYCRKMHYLCHFETDK